MHEKSGLRPFDRRNDEKVSLADAKRELQGKLDILSSCDGFFDMVRREIDNVGLNYSQCAKCLRKIGISNASDMEVRGVGNYGGFVYRGTLDGLVKVLGAAAALTDEEKSALMGRRERSYPHLAAAKIADAVIARLRSENGVQSGGMSFGR
ncbi:MAG: hypothetical protein KGJ06_02210 [Pseudomonadota bacterium]|nr:hypothetical protein [Pseudomonadota bacterium]